MEIHEDKLKVDNGTTTSGTVMPVRERLINAASLAFAERGFGSVSVREICQAADTGINMVHHYFGSKQGLLDAILQRYGENVYAVPLRLLASPASSVEDFSSRIELLLETTLESCLNNRSIMMVALREQTELTPLMAFQSAFVAFLNDAKREGFVRKELDAGMISGAILDRVINLAQFTLWLKQTAGVDVFTDQAYRRRWCRANADMFLNGFLDR